MVPVAKSQAVAGWSSSKIDDEGENDEAYDGDDFDTGKTEFGLSIDRDGEDVEADDKDNDD